jgi:hypothetical protein
MRRRQRTAPKLKFTQQLERSIYTRDHILLLLYRIRCVLIVYVYAPPTVHITLSNLCSAAYYSLHRPTTALCMFVFSNSMHACYCQHLLKLQLLLLMLVPLQLRVC